MIKLLLPWNWQGQQQRRQWQGQGQVAMTVAVAVAVVASMCVGWEVRGRKEEDDVLLVEAKTQLSINIKCLLSFGVTSASLL